MNPLAKLAGFAVALVVGVAFVAIERRREHPMLDVSLFRERAFSAASGAVTVAFFALFGFIFLITQYMQFIRGWGTLSTGARILPVAVSIGAASVLVGLLVSWHAATAAGASVAGTAIAVAAVSWAVRSAASALASRSGPQPVAA